jgi:hypothetical protein
VSECGLRRERVLREPAHQREVVAIHLVSASEPAHPIADVVHDPGDVRSERAASRDPNTAHPRISRRPAQALPIAEVDRSGGDPHPHLSGRGRRYRYVLDTEHIGRPVPVVDDRLHGPTEAHLGMVAT